MDTNFQKLSLDLLSHLKIPYKFVPRPRRKTYVEEIGEYSVFVRRIPTRDYMWDGKSIYLYPSNGFSNTIHELSHWLIATPKQRKLPEFGLGDSPELTRIEDDDVGDLDTDSIETQASALGLAIEKCLGFPNWEDNAAYQSWDTYKHVHLVEDSLEYFWKNRGYKGLYNSKGYPTILLKLKGWLRTNPNYAGR